MNMDGHDVQDDFSLLVDSLIEDIECTTDEWTGHSYARLLNDLGSPGRLICWFPLLQKREDFTLVVAISPFLERRSVLRVK
jgi:hypothetical protein